MDDRTLRVLEYDKILALLADAGASSLGKARALALEPATDAAVVRARLRDTSQAAYLIGRYGSMPLGGLTDVTDHLKRARAQVTLAGTELLAVGNLLYCAERMREYFAEGEDLAPDLAAEAAQLSDQTALHAQIERVLDDEGEVRRNASDELERLYHRQATLEGRARDRMDSLMRQAAANDVLQDPIIVQREGRFCLPVRSDRQGQLRGLVHDRSDSGATVFIEPFEIVAMGNELREIEIEIIAEIKRLLRELSAQVGAAATDLLRDLDALARLDFLNACGRLARSLGGVEPLVREDGALHLKQARHPLLAGNVVPVDFWLGEQFHTLLITGPNTGGKTVTLKTVGLLTLMAQSGLHIPAEPGSSVHVFESVWADIGDEQSIEQSLSTFSSHMTQIIKTVSRVEAWRQRATRDVTTPEDVGAVTDRDRPVSQSRSVTAPTPGLGRPTGQTMNCLILLDELGAGTDPAEGAALGQAILEELHAAGCRTVATTHYNDLKVFAYATEGMENASVEFDVKSLQPTYRLLIGEPGSSNALQIAQRLGLPRRIVSVAREFLGGERLSVEDALREMRQSRVDLDRERKQTTKAQRDLEKLRAEYERNLQELQTQRSEAMEQGYDRALQIVRRAEEEARRIIAELQRQPRQSKVTEDKRREVAALRARIEREAADSASAPPQGPAPLEGLHAPEGVSPEAHPAPGGRAPGGPETVGDTTAAGVRPLHVGATVRLTTMNREGRIVERLRQDRYLVEVGRLRIEAAAAELEPAEEPVSEEARRLAHTMQMRKAPTFDSEIDLRGTTVDEAILTLEKYLDDAQLTGATQVRLVHGKGTGALRQGIQKFLRSHRGVKSFAIAPFGEGGDGVTVVELK
jgi:DNA mismatch repair protein MutS2